MKEQYQRSEMLFGSDAMQRLRNAEVAVFGIGGVGGHAAEALARSGVGRIHLIDSDRVALSNLNRQAVALHSTIGMYKVDVMLERIKDIDPDIEVITHKTFFSEETVGEFDFSRFDMVIDAIDSVPSKLLLIECATAQSCGIVSSMGAGNKLDPTAFEVADIYSTSVCPLARALRSQLRRRGIRSLKVVYSKEQPVIPPKEDGRAVPASNAFVPATAGLILAGEAVKTIIGKV